MEEGERERRRRGGKEKTYPKEKMSIAGVRLNRLLLLLDVKSLTNLSGAM